MSYYQRFMTALRVGIQAFNNPESIMAGQNNARRNNLYLLAWYYYRNLMFSGTVSDWNLYLSDQKLYKYTRLIYNPVTSIVDFYVDNIWKEMSQELNDALVTPLMDNTEENVVNAVAQLDQWSNWQSEKQKVKRYVAATGNCLLELIDDLEREKILQKTIWPGYVKEFELNDTGDLMSYVIEYPVWDSEQKQSYRYKKVVNKETFSYFRDDAPFTPPGRLSPVEENPYKFCPAVWFKHIDDGSDYGLAAVTNLEKVNETNSLASHLHDNIHKEIEAAKIIGVEDPKTIQVLTGGSTNKDGSINETDPRLDRVLLAAKGQVSVNDLAGLLKLAEAEPYLLNLIKSFNDDYPELQAAAIIKENSQLSGAALERLLTPAQNRLDNSQGYYNRQLTKFRQMGISVAGWRWKNGWKNRTHQQEVFAEFDLTSYEHGDIDFQLKKSILISESEDDREDLAIKKANRANLLSGLVSEKEQLRISGYNDDKIKEILKEMEKENEVREPEGQGQQQNGTADPNLGLSE